MLITELSLRQQSRKPLQVNTVVSFNTMDIAIPPTAHKLDQLATLITHWCESESDRLFVSL